MSSYDTVRSESRHPKSLLVSLWAVEEEPVYHFAVSLEALHFDASDCNRNTASAKPTLRKVTAALKPKCGLRFC